MNFQGLKKIENANFYLDVAFRKAKNAASLSRGTLKGKSRQQKSAIIEQKRITNAAATLVKHLNKIIEAYPSMDDLPEFYIELVKTRYNIDDIKKSLGSIDWAISLINKLSNKYSNLKDTDLTKINSRRREFYGRVSSVMKRIDKHLSFLEKARAFLRGLPNVKTSLFTVAIAGFPNVGKSTLLTKLTSSTPKIAAYPFTTKGLNMGTFTYRHEKIQLIDTPGTLNRNKENPIETLAYLAMKYCSSLIVYVLDPTYDENKQKKLILRLKKSGKPVIIYMSKTDIAKPLDGYDAVVDVDKLKKKIVEYV